MVETFDPNSRQIMTLQLDQVHLNGSVGGPSRDGNRLSAAGYPAAQQGEESLRHDQLILRGCLANHWIRLHEAQIRITAE